ncbi:MAG: tape measure protein, partial [Dolichospermum sp.]
MAVNMVAPHVAKLIDGIQRVEVLQRRFKFLGGSTEGGKAEFNYAKDIANKLNVPSEVAANSYSQLAIAAKDSKMEGQGVKELFEGITSSLSALGINGQDASLVFMAYTQILAKGKLSMEELRQQLGEKFPPAMGVFAKAMGVSVPEMNALVASGSVLSQDILPKVAKVLKEDYGNAAADQAGGLVVALNKLGNVGFEITTIFANQIGGTLGSFVDFFANVLGLLKNILNDLIPLAQSFMIGFAATITIGLTIILSKFKPFLVMMGSLQNFLLATFSAITTNMMPMIIGVTSDVADGWLGAEKDLISNMMDGFGNLAVTILGALDTAMRSMSDNKFSFSSVFGNLIQGAQQTGNVMEWLKGVFAGFFKILPGGVLELLAIVFMIEQGTGLFNMALWPAIEKLLGGFGGMLNGARMAFFNFMRSIALGTELMMTTMNKATAATELLGDRHEARVAILRGSLVFLQTILTKVALVYALLMFSKGDFSDPMRESINKSTADINKHLTDVRLNINKTTEAFNKATKSVEELGKGIANALPSKGVQLDIRSLWGGGDWKWDDAVRETNAKYREGDKGASPQGPSAMDVIGTGALYAGGAGYAVAAGSKAIKAIVDLAVKAAPILEANKALAAQGIQATSITRVPLFGKLATAIAPVVAIMGPWGLAIAGLITAVIAATVALDLFAPKITQKQLDALPDEIKQIINAKKEGERLDLASQQVIKLYNDQKLNNERLREFANSVGLDGDPNNFVAPRVAAMPEKQRKKFELTDKAKNINTDIENKRKSLKAIEDNADTEVEKSAARSGDSYKKVQAELAQLEKNKKLMQLNFMASYGNKSSMDAIDEEIKKKEAEIRKAVEQVPESTPWIVSSYEGLGGFAPVNKPVVPKDLKPKEDL